jgi:phage terminase small subunit
MALTPKQEAFACAYVETGNASEAYRRAYDAENMKPETVWKRACELLACGKVAGRASELQAAAAERCIVTVASITQELEEARALALQEAQASAAVSASMGKAKLHGLIVEKRDHRSSDGSMTPKSGLDASKLSAEALREILNAANGG